MNARSLFLIRGLPGSGKSELSKSLSEGGKYPVFCVDDYFTNSIGEYQFDFDKNHLAYSACSSKTEESMKLNTAKIFVENVFSFEWEMEPYFKLAADYGYRVYVMTCENRHDGKNIHQITQEQIEKMAAKFKVKLF